MEDESLYHQTIRLTDGRTLGYAESGDLDGQPLLMIHGSPGSRLDALYLKACDLSGLKMRAVAPDRPGMGLSDFQTRRTFLGFANDVRMLADHMGWTRFALMGISGGGPYAAACAAALPDRMTRVGLVSCVAPLDVPGVTVGMGPGKTIFKLSSRFPWFVQRLLGGMAKGLRSNPDQVLAQAAGAFSELDQVLMKRPEIGQTFIASLSEAYRNGPKGVVYDMGLYASPWGFRLEDIRVPVFLWHGEADRNAPIAMGRYLSKAIPGCQAHFYPGEGHLTVFINQAQAIFRTLVNEAVPFA